MDRHRASAETEPLPIAAAPTAPRGDDAYDALTDLFLGEVASGDGAEAASPAVGECSGRCRVDRDETEERDERGFPQLHGALPVDDDERAGRGGAAGGSRVELLVLGHLPVLATAWAAQYARDLSGSLGATVGFLRLGERHASLTVYGARGGEACAGAPGEGLEDVLRSAAPGVDRWVVRVDELDEPEALGAIGSSSVTVLTGAHRAAVVAAYRALKTIRQGTSLLDEDGSGPAVGAAVMGADAGEAEETARRLADAAATHLGRRISVRVGARRIGGGDAGVRLFDGAVEIGVGEAIRLLERVAAGAGAERDRHRDNGVAPVGEEVDAAAGVGVDGEGGVEGDVGVGFARPGRWGQETAEFARPGRPRPWGDGEAGHDGSPPLWRFVPGLREVGARCPYAEGVGIAVDESGTPHLLAVDDGDGGGGGAVPALLTAAAWLRDHASLVASRLPGGDLAQLDRRPVMHLFTTRPAGARRLLDADLCVHVLGRVEVKGCGGWFSTRLN